MRRILNNLAFLLGSVYSYGEICYDGYECESGCCINYYCEPYS